MSTALNVLVGRRPFAGTLRARLTAVLALVMLSGTALVLLVAARQSAITHLAAQETIGRGLLEALALGVRAAEHAETALGLDNVVGRLAADPSVAAVRLEDAKGSTLFEYARPDETPSWYTALLAPEVRTPRELTAAIRVGGAPARLVLTLADAPLNAALSATLVRGAAVGAALVLPALLLAYTLLARLTAPLRPLAQWVREFARGNWKPGVELIPSGSREIRDLNEAVTEGSAALRHYISRLSEARELLEHNENQLRKLIDSMHEILFELDAEGRLVFLNPAWERLTGFRIDDALGRPFAEFLADDEAARDFAPDRLAGLHAKNREISLRAANGRRLWVSLDADVQHDGAGNLTGVIGTFGDITRSVELNRLLTRYQDELYHMSVTDPLTGLYNRRHFDTQLEVILSDHLARNRPVCLLLIDLDGFKFINDTYGHPFGDEVLRTMAQLLKRLVRRNDYIARLAGDEFAMVLKSTTLENARKIAQKLHQEISRTRVPLPVGSIQLQSSIGVAEAPTHGRKAQELVSAADVALYHSKRRGRNRIEVLSPDVSQAMMSIFSQGFRLRNALERGNIYPALQPICRIATGEPIAYEVLARMRIDGTVVRAQEFITIAEELGLTREVDLHIIRTALAMTPPEQALFLNVDLSSFNDPEFVRDLAALLRPACEAGRMLTIEITERESIPISDTLRRDIQTLREFGCRLALDDFGSGYSTYNFLNQFRPDFLKIEGSFVRGMLENESDRKIVEHIHELARAFGVETIAESVENETTQRALREIGIPNAQGLLYGEPRLCA